MEEPRIVTILVTGFGPCRNEPVNPSYLIATTLPPFIPPTATCPVAVRIVFYPYQIPVSYDEVRSLVPRLYAGYKESVNIVLHMGMSISRNHYSIEKQAHRDDYDTHADIDGTKPDKLDGARYWPDCPTVLETSLNFDDVFQRWRGYLLDSAPDIAASISSSSSVLEGVVLRPSLDAGHFLCDFIYYSSLAEHWRRKRTRSQPTDDMNERPVMFMHVPSWAGAPDLEKGRAVTIALLRALARSWVERKSAEMACRR